MLFTRCPECATTFRVTDEALTKASGQVRCGRCATVFNALTEQISAAAERPPAEADESAVEPAKAPGAPAAAAPHASAPPPPAAAEAKQRAAPADEPADTTATSIGADSVAGVVAEAELAAAGPNASEEAPDAAISGIDIFSAEQVEEVLATTEAAHAATPWATTVRQRTSRWWAAWASAAVFVLGAQVVNHYRATLAGEPTLGPWVQRAYALIGVVVIPRWDVRQYEILDWVATAEPSTGSAGSLKISARIQNRGRERQPYPSVQLRLKDRWEEAVGSRIFTPDEYLSHDAPHARLMSPGETANAEIEVVDPGPDAYGFELDVCIEVEANKLTCRNDKVFL
jgi:predicted Zn finger-like uncharacterized protein